MKLNRCVVIEKHQGSDNHPLIIKKGEILRYERKETEWEGWIWCMDNSGKGGWVPEAYLNLQETHCEVLQDYNAIELTVNIGEEFIIEKEESGWFWVRDEGGREGWIPIISVRIIE
jgi:uncharacterized protein YgiM (DUF1202 family)